jgi:hypothetical protein
MAAVPGLSRDALWGGITKPGVRNIAVCTMANMRIMHIPISGAADKNRGIIDLGVASIYNALHLHFFLMLPTTPLVTNS